MWSDSPRGLALGTPKPRRLPFPCQQPQQRQSVGGSQGGTPVGEGHPDVTVPPPLTSQGVCVSLSRLTVPRLTSPPLASGSRVCSTSGLLAKMQVGCSTVPCLACVWKICRGQSRRQVTEAVGPTLPLPRTLFLYSLGQIPPSMSPLRSPLLQEAFPDSPTLHWSPVRAGPGLCP